MNIGQFFSYAGQTNEAIRQSQEAERVARQNQLAIEEQNRLADLRKQEQAMADRLYGSREVPDFTQPSIPIPPAPPTAPTAPTAPVPRVSVAPVARPTTPTTPTTPAAPAAPVLSPVQQAATQAASQRPQVTDKSGVGRGGAAQRAQLRRDIQKEAEQAWSTYESTLPSITRGARGRGSPASRAREAEKNQFIEAYTSQVFGRPVGTAAPAERQTPAQPAPPAARAGLQTPAAPAAPAAVRQAPTQVAQPAAPAPGLLEVPQSQERNMQMAESYLAKPETVPYELQQLQQMAQQQAALLTRQRNEAAQLAQMYMRSGTAYGSQQAEALRATVNQLDVGLLTLEQQVVQKQMYLQGMQGLRELASANDARRLSGVLSQYMGVPVAFQRRPDGTWNYFVNGKKVAEGLSTSAVAEGALREFSPEARQAAAASAALENELALKRKYGDATVNAMRDIQKAIIDGEYKLAEERAKRQGLDVKFDTANGRWAITKDKETIYIVNPNEVREEKTGFGTITLPPVGRPIILGR